MKIKIITFGCSNNQAESEVMAGLLKKANHEIVEEKEEITIVNVCSVKGPSLNKGIKEIKKAKTPVIVAGCIPKSSIEQLKSLREDITLITTHNFDRIVEAVESNKDFLEKSNKPKICLPKARKNPIINIVPISSGCKGQCSYCSVKPIKGKLYSFPPELIIKEIKESLEKGCKEIWLTAQDTGCYGLDINYNLPKLLKHILEIEGDFKLRLGMANPQFIYRYLDEIIEILNNKRVFKFLHLPVQSGSDRILWLMKRAYNSRQYKEMIKRLKQAHPDITISTDIIVGFPTETEEDFQESLNLIQETKPDVLNLSKFWLRPNTEAETLEQLPGDIIKERSTRMKDIFNKIALENNQKWISWEGNTVIDERGKLDSFIGRNYAYKPVIVKGYYKLGEKIKVKIKQATLHDIRA